MSSIHFVNVASLVPNQRHCNLRLRVLSVETIAETIDPENQVNLLARNARLQLLNAHVNMYRGFMRLEVNEEEEEEEAEEGNHDTNDGSRERASITAILDDEDVNGAVDQRDHDDGGGVTAPTLAISPNHSGTNSAFSTTAASTSLPTVATVSSETSPTAALPASLALTPPPTEPSGSLLSSSSTTAMSSIALTASASPSSSRDQMEVEMRLGTGGSVSLMEYYRTMEYTYFSTVEPVGR
ncbi:hypothetical protein BGZ70_004321 [Mortierella alpina]|uniref:Single-stranded DNA binding protein Ssb-like OB fold domain-containing protein n=1 Tax=Mortierella alpina TaxID=64518 RepID=A0A9P6JA51_MORAP|nr:hypothetical protein BGZ70_004321 [Mortierella alpina]